MFQHQLQWLHLHQLSWLSQHLHQPLLLLLRPLMLLLTLQKLLPPMHRKLLMQPKMLRKMQARMHMLLKTQPKMRLKLLTLQRSNSLPHFKKTDVRVGFFWPLNLYRRARWVSDRSPQAAHSTQPVKASQQ